MLTRFCFCPLFVRTLAQRARCAAAIRALPAAEILRLIPVRLPYEPPSSAASAASSCSTVLAARSRSFRNCWTTPAKFIEFSSPGILSRCRSESRFWGDLAAEWCSGSSRPPQPLFSTFVTTYKATWCAAWMLRARSQSARTCWTEPDGEYKAKVLDCRSGYESSNGRSSSTNAVTASGS